MECMNWSIPVFGVRHLSPAGAWHLRRALDEQRPKVVLIEGLADASDLIPHLVNSRTKPPVAILAYTCTLPVRTIVYPLARYSPEYQAMLWAKENKARVEFIDLPSDVFLGLQEAMLEKSLKPKDEEEKEELAEDLAKPEPKRSIYERMAEHAGEPDHETYWERRFEHNLNPEAYRRAIFEFGNALREEDDAPAWRAENLVREAYMRKRIESVLAEGIAPEKIIAVVGAFHAPVLNGNHPAMTDAEFDSLRRRPSTLTLMPYSFLKLSTQSGYGAGNSAPAYHELVWDMLNAERPDELPMEYLARIARHLREKGTHRSTAEVIEGVRLARTLAAMHEGSAPTLRDLQDAAVTLIGQGEPSVVSEALAHANVGTAIGELPPGVSKTSIQDDFDRLLKTLKLEKYRTAVAQELLLDLRENRHVKTPEAAYLDLNRSTFFHRLKVLGIGFATFVPLREGSTTWAEKWKLQWTPESEIALVEAVLLGETVELATAYTFKTLLEACKGIGAAADIVMGACECGLAASMELARAKLQELASASSEFKAIAHAAFQLSQVARYGDVRKFDPSPLLPLMDELFVQGSLSLFNAAGCDARAAADLTHSLEEMNRVSLEHHHRVDGCLWIGQLQKLANADDRNPLLSGYACAILLERALIANNDLAREVSRRLSPGVPADLGAGWFEGLASRNRASLLRRQALWVELAQYVKQLDDDQFKRAIVFLRRAFGSFSPQQKRAICENLGEFWGVGAENASEALSTPLSESEEAKLQELNELDFGDV
jgi:hypothetical protein